MIPPTKETVYDNSVSTALIAVAVQLQRYYIHILLILMTPVLLHANQSHLFALTYGPNFPRQLRHDQTRPPSECALRSQYIWTNIQYTVYNITREDINATLIPYIPQAQRVGRNGEVPSDMNQI